MHNPLAHRNEARRPQLYLCHHGTQHLVHANSFHRSFLCLQTYCRRAEPSTTGSQVLVGRCCHFTWVLCQRHQLDHGLLVRNSADLYLMESSDE